MQRSFGGWGVVAVTKGVPPVGVEPTLGTLLGGRPLPLGYGGWVMIPRRVRTILAQANRERKIHPSAQIQFTVLQPRMRSVTNLPNFCIHRALSVAGTERPSRVRTRLQCGLPPTIPPPAPPPTDPPCFPSRPRRPPRGSRSHAARRTPAVSRPSALSRPSAGDQAGHSRTDPQQ